MKIAFAGKGGTGKTAVAAMVTRILAADGRDVLAIDLDVNPGLDMALGPLSTNGRLPAEAVEEREDGQYGWGLKRGLEPADAVLTHAAEGRDGLRLLSLGTIDSGNHDLSRTHYAVREIGAGFDMPGWDVVADLEAGTKDVYDGSYIPFVDVLVLITDGSDTANLTCRRLHGICAKQGGPETVLLANRAGERLGRVRDLATELGIDVVGSIPRDDAVLEADGGGVAVYDYAPGGAAVAAVRGAVEALTSHIREGTT